VTPQISVCDSVRVLLHFNVCGTASQSAADGRKAPQEKRGAMKRKTETSIYLFECCVFFCGCHESTGILRFKLRVPGRGRNDEIGLGKALGQQPCCFKRAHHVVAALHNSGRNPANLCKLLRLEQEPVARKEPSVEKVVVFDGSKLKSKLVFSKFRQIVGSQQMRSAAFPQCPRTSRFEPNL